MSDENDSYSKNSSMTAEGGFIQQIHTNHSSTHWDHVAMDICYTKAICDELDQTTLAAGTIWLAECT